MKPTLWTALVLSAWLRVIASASRNLASTEEGGDSDDSSEGLTCYVCTWVDDLNPCGDANFTLEPEQHGHYMVNCRVCYKKIMYNSTGTKLRILRGCVLDEWAYLPKCQYIYFENGLYTEVCGCSEDYCNLASRSYPGASIVLLTLLAVGALALGRIRASPFP